jgi:outer membrane immunogenic protein
MHRGVVASIVGAGLSIGFGGVASAADLAPAPAPIYTKAAAPIPYSWTGFYAGEQAGYGWSADDVNTAGTPISFDPIGGAGALAIMNASAGGAELDFNTRPKGFLGGGTLGYNLQTGVFVLGVETDLSWADIKGTATAARTAPIVGFTPLVVTAIGTAEQKMDAFGTLRARLGVLPTDKLLIYETGGVAYGHVESNTNIGEAIPTVPVISLANAIGSASAWRVGWTAGAGLEYAFAPHWTAKAEYLYYDLGSISYSSTMVSTVPGSPVFTSVGVNSSADFKGNIVRGGINYKFW